MFSAFYRRSFGVATAAMLGYLLIRVLEPLSGALEWAAVLAFLLHPLHQMLARKLKGRNALSAGILTALTPFTVLAPLSVLGVVFAGQVGSLVQYLRGRTWLPYQDLLPQLEAYPLVGPIAHWVRDNAPISAEQLQSWLTEGLQALLKGAATVGGNVALTIFGTLIGFFMMLFLLFFFLRDGRAIISGLTRAIPLERGRRAELLNYLADVTRAVVFGSTATALISGLFVGVGFAIAGLPSPVVFGVVATIAAFLPSGAGIVSIPAALYLLIDGRWGAGLFLALWTAAMIVVENIVRPILTAHRAEVSTLAIFVGAIGGAAEFGVLGLLIGPVLLSFVVALVRFAQEPPPR